MNYKLFNNHMSMLFKIIRNNNIDPDEIEVKKETIKKEFISMLKKREITSRFYNLSHEIRCLEFLNKYGNLQIAKDSKSKPGCDFILNNDIQIEAVCCSRGDEKINGLNKIPESGIIDNIPKEKILLSRITTAIDTKIDFYEDHKNKSIDSRKPYVIFIGLGNLTYGMMRQNYGFELNKVLCGVEYAQILIDSKTNKQIGSNFSYRESFSITKYNEENNSKEVNIPCIYFNKPEFNVVSAIIYSNASLESNYNETNTFIFLNPWAKNKLKIKEFPNVYYWEMNNSGNYILKKDEKSYKCNGF